MLWCVSNAVSLLIGSLPPRLKQLITDVIALSVYWPLIRFAALAEATGMPVGPSP
jgi:hypothetical protein